MMRYSVLRLLTTPLLRLGGLPAPYKACDALSQRACQEQEKDVEPQGRDAQVAEESAAALGEDWVGDGKGHMRKGREVKVSLGASGKESGLR